MKLFVLKYQESVKECRDVAQMLDLLGLYYSRIPVQGLYQAELRLGINEINGIDNIRKLILSGDLQRWQDSDGSFVLSYSDDEDYHICRRIFGSMIGAEKYYTEHYKAWPNVRITKMKL
jgi:hypothetical protein